MVFVTQLIWLAYYSGKICWNEFFFHSRIDRYKFDSLFVSIEMFKRKEIGANVGFK